jgi:hypothetical protein
VPFAQLDAYRLGDDLSPSALLINLADQLELDIEPQGNGVSSFDRLLPCFITALAQSGYRMVALMVDDYDRLFHLVDPWLRNLFRAVQGVDQFIGLPSHSPGVPPEALPQILTVINGHEPVVERWPPNPLYHRVLETIHLVDFSFSETSDYLNHRGIDEQVHRQLFRLTQGHPLMLALVVSLCEDHNLPPMPEATDKVMKHILTWALRDVEEDADRSQVRVTELLRASAVVRRFNQPLLAAMLNQSWIPDELFDQVTALSMVTERKSYLGATGAVFANARLFVLHDVLRRALLEDAQHRGLSEWMDDYRRRALSFYTRRLSGAPEGTLGEAGLDLLFLQRNPLIRDMFFGWSWAPLSSERATYDEVAAVLEPLMRENFYYQILDFSGEALERLIEETQAWLALDRELHGEHLRYFHIVRRSNASGHAGRGDIAGFTLAVPVTEATLSHLREDTVGAACEAGLGPIELREGAQTYLALRLVADGLDSFSAMLRTIFLLMASQSFEVLLTAIPWPQLSKVLKTLGFDILGRQVEYEGYTYDLLQLDVQRRGGAAGWLFQLVREDLGLPSSGLFEDWEGFKETLQQALERLHDSFHVQAKSPLIEEFVLVDSGADEWERAEALVEALRAVLETMRLPADYDRPDAAFHILNQRYGIIGEAWQRFEFAGKPSIDEVAEALNCSRGTLYKRLDEALEAFARAFRRQRED